MTLLPIREFQVRARSTDVFGRVLCNARDHHFIVDGPAYNNCPGEELTPPEAFLVAVASCGIELVQVIARESGKSVGAVSLAVEGTVDRNTQPRTDVTVFSTMRMNFSIGGTDAATAAALVEGFRRR